MSFARVKLAVNKNYIKHGRPVQVLAGVEVEFNKDEHYGRICGTVDCFHIEASEVTAVEVALSSQSVALENQG